MDTVKHFWKSLLTRYSRVPSDEPDLALEIESHKLHSHGSPITKEISRVWILATLFFVMTSMYLLFNNWELRNKMGLGVYNRAFDTEFLSAASAVKSTKTRFSGSPQFDSAGEEYFLSDSDISEFVGQPSPEIDEAWKIITGGIGGRYFLITDEEAEQSWGKNLEQYWDDHRGGYRAGLDVFHSLHCLNHIRMALYPEYYHQKKVHGRKHTDHCINQIRQHIMCHGDSTPIPTKYFPGYGGNYIDADQVHTCRDFESLLQWTKGRHNGSEAVQPRNRDGTPKKLDFEEP